MRRLTHTLLTAVLIAAPGLVWAAPPDLMLPPLSMQVDSGGSITATGLDFMDHPQSGSVNFNPGNYDVHLNTGVVLPVQDVVAYSGVTQVLKDCQNYAQIGTETITSFMNFMANTLAPKLGFPMTPLDAAKVQALKDFFLMGCNAKTPQEQEQLFTTNSVPHQVLADVRNTASNATDIVFSGEALDPYTAGYPLATGSVGTVVGFGPDGGPDAVIVGNTEKPMLDGFSNTDKTIETPLLSAALTLLRFVPDAAQKKVLLTNSYSSGWLDRPYKDAAGAVINNCLQESKDPKNPIIPKSDADLLKAGCVGERNVVAIAAPHLYVNSNKDLEDQGKSKDLAAVSRAPLGKLTDPKAKGGYLTIYRRTAAVPGDTSIFQDLWKFEKSVTNANNGIPEPYGIAVVKNTDAKTGKPATDAVVVTSNKAVNDRYFVYYFTNGMAEPKAVFVGFANNDPQLGFGEFGPYGAYSSDFNFDKCGDLAITRARISPDGKKITFADFFDVHLQAQDAAGACTGNFDAKGTRYQVPPIAPQKLPQISSLVIADFNKDGRNDVVAGDFTTYMNAASKKQESVVHFLEYKNGLFNTVGPRYFPVTVKGHDDSVGVIDVKADSHANLGVVTGNAMVLPPWIPPPVIPNPCAKDPATGMVDPKLIDPATCGICRPGSDFDKDGHDDFPAFNSVKVKTCVNGVMVDKDMFLNPNQPFTYSPDCKISDTKTGRQWMHEWAGCDNCGATDTCNGAEDGDAAKNACWNPSQADDNADGYGNICSPGKPVVSKTCGTNGITVYEASWLDPALNNDKDKDSIPDCVVYNSNGIPTTGNCKMACDNCSQYHAPDAAAQDACKTTPEKCANPDQKDSNGDSFGDVCSSGAANVPPTKCSDGTPFDATWFQALDPTMPALDPNNDTNKNGIPDCKVYTGADGKLYKDCKQDCEANNPQHLAQLKVPREDKVMYADDPPVIALQSDLKLTAGPVVPDNGHEVTVLLNKTGITPTPPPCQNGDLTCICQQNPDLQLCKCQKDPNAPGCVTGPNPQVSCCLDVCRGDLTAPFPAMCDFIRPYNDQIRKITGLCMDVLVPVEGTQYHLSCTMPNAPALDLGGGLAYAQVFKTSGGQIPKNYFKDWHKPDHRQLLTKNLLLNPLGEASTGGKQFDVNALPKPDFAFDTSLSAVAPDAAVNQAPGITQIDGVMQIETYLADVNPATGAPVTKQAAGLGGAAPAVTKALLLDIKGYSSPPGCQWAGPDCPEPMPNPPPPQVFVDAIQAKVTEFEKAGKPVTIDTINEAFKSMDVGPAFLHQQFAVVGSQGATVLPVQNVMGGFSPEGGCGCSFAAASSVHNTLLPLLMSVTALGGMVALRRRSAKKR